MKRKIPLLLTVFSLMTFVHAQAPKSPGTISITMDRVMLEDVIRIFSRSSGATIHYAPEDTVFKETVSTNVDNQPWDAVLRGLISPFGMVLLENEPMPGAYTIARAGDPGTAVRIRSAQETNAVIQSALEALETGDADKARDLLGTLHKANETLIQSASPPPRSVCSARSNTASSHAAPAGG